MRNILDIYKEYKIMPNLVEHQLRVAGVAIQICEAFEEAGIEVEKDNIIKACLLHDMGNIIKFKLDYFPKFLEPEGLEYWQKVQNEYIEKYGKDEHHATMDITVELGMNENIIKNIDGVGFSNWYKISEHGNWSQKICAYADTRVIPTGVASLEKRIEDALKRYNDKYPDLESDIILLHNSMREIEKQIFNNLNIKPEDITEESVKRYFDYLKTAQI